MPWGGAWTHRRPGVTGTAGHIAGAFDPIDPDGRHEGVADLVALRPAPDIAAKLDLLCCLHWAGRENQLCGAPEEWPEPLVPGAIWERRHALEWLIQVDVDWDDVDLST
jgi:hypothetical protein